MISESINLNDLKIFTKDKNETIAIGEIIRYDGKVGETDWISSIDLNLRSKELTVCFKIGDPLSVLKGFKLIKVKPIASYQSEIIKIIEDADFVDRLVKQNSFKRVTRQLFKLGITRQLINDIPVGYAYYGMREICACDREHCYHSNVLILKYEYHFVIPFMFSFAAPDCYFDFGIRTMTPIKEYNLNEEDEEDWENVFDEEMNYLGKREPEFLSSHMAKREDFKVEEGNLFEMKFII